jgi:signal transduction histidine kinase
MPARLDLQAPAVRDVLREVRRQAAVEERRRIMRDLHDGAQQSLFALGVKLALAESLVHDPEGLRQLLGAARRDVVHALDVVRGALSGDAPLSLIDGGLSAALTACARQAPVRIDVHCTGERYPERIEACVYFCCVEAMQNLVRHADAGRGSVQVFRDDNRLRFEVGDDGNGFDRRRWSPARGLQNLQDRLLALGGELSVSSTPGIGTTVAGWVPLP